MQFAEVPQVFVQETIKICDLYITHNVKNALVHLIWPTVDTVNKNVNVYVSLYTTTLCSLWLLACYDTTRYEMLFNVRSKANISQLNVSHGTKNKKGKKEN